MNPFMLRSSADAPPARATTSNPVLWGAYLACSWTWCIGMFLPALLLRDMGWGGFLIFAIPNVLGAAAMGWTLGSRAASEKMVERNPAAIWWFSTITLAFHVFWMLWVMHFVRLAFPIPDSYLFTVGAIVIAFLVVAKRAARMGRMPQLAGVLLVLSVGVLVAAFALPDLSYATDAMIDEAPRSLAPLWMLPITIFGFTLCPYLDITFHHARQELDSSRNGRVGFTLGFVVFFALMIILTTRYSGAIVAAMQGREVNPTRSLWIGGAVMTHILCQWIFTVLAHIDRMKTIPGSTPDRQQLFFILILAAGLVGLVAPRIAPHSGLTGGELVYRCFLGAYGLVFPAYMLYRVVLAQRGSAPLSNRLMWIGVLAATPLFWMGFMERQPIWLTPGILVVLVGAFALWIQPLKSIGGGAPGERLG